MNVIITGATKGIGHAIALRLAKQGHTLCLCSRNIEDLKTMASDIKNTFDGNCFISECDVQSKSEVEKFADFALKSFDGKVDVLVNNAGVFLPGAISEEPAGHLEQMVETNLYSAYHLSRKIIPSMQQHKSGLIVNMCSIASKIAYPNGGSYSISKFALLGFTKVLREELKDSGIAVTAILPGATWSNSWAGVELPEDRLMQAKDIAVVVASLLELSPAAVMEEVILRPQLGDL